MRLALAAALILAACGAASAQDIGDESMLHGDMSPQAMSSGFVRTTTPAQYPSGAVVFIDADNIAGADGSSIATWPATGATLTPVVADQAHEAILEKAAINGHAAAGFSGTATAYVLTGSSSSLAFIPNTLIFDFFVVVEIDAVPNSGGTFFFSNFVSGSDRGFWFILNASSQTWAAVCKGDGNCHLNKQSATATSQMKWHLMEFRGDGVNFKYSLDGGAYETTAFGVATTTGNLTSDAALGMNQPTGSAFTDMRVAQVIGWNRVLSTTETTQVRNATTARYGSMPVSPARRVEFLGNSITFGGHVSIPFPLRLEATVNTASPGSIATANHGLNADVTSNMLTRYNGFIHGQLGTHLVFEGCINNLANGADTAPAQAAAEAGCESDVNSIVTAARADGMEICLLTITPWASSSLSSTNKQNATATFRTFINGLNGSQSGHVHVYDAGADPNLGTGSPPQLKPANDSGDGSHPSQAGSDIMATGEQTCFGF